MLQRVRRKIQKIHLLKISTTSMSVDSNSNPDTDFAMLNSPTSESASGAVAFGGGSALLLCGRRWNFSADDLLFPSCIRLCLYVPLLIALSIVYGLLPAAACTNDNRLNLFAACTIALFALFVAIDIGSMYLALRTQFLQPSAAIVRLIYFRFLVFLFHLANTISGTIIVFSGINDCASSGLQLNTVARVVTVINWTVIVGTLCGYFAAYDNEGHLINEFSSENKLENMLHLITCSWCWRSDSSGVMRQPDVFSLIAKQMRTLFSDAHSLVLSDIMMGMVLVRALQKRQRRLGKKFLISDQKSAGIADPDSLNIEMGANARGSFSGDDDAQAAQKGQQPHLSELSLRSISAAQYYIRYAIGSYGWPLYCFMQPCTWCCGLANACCLPSTELRADNCCHCSVKAFLNRSKLEETTHIVAGNLETDFGQAIYYVAADHAQRTLVIAVRGSMSLQDVVTDVYAVPTNMQEHGLAEFYTHSGFAAIATWLCEDLHRSGVIDSFLSAQPDYGLVICGHSLGAATATVAGLLLRSKYPMIKCFAYAPPPTADLVHAELCDEFVTSIVYNHDMITRLSLPSLRLLKDQMLWSFVNCPLRKWEVIGESLRPDCDENPDQGTESERLRGAEADSALFLNMSSEQLMRVGQPSPHDQVLLLKRSMPFFPQFVT
jgi:sn1-specific diacylglycerol lipase